MQILHIVSSLRKGSGVMEFLIKYNREISHHGVTFNYIYLEEAKNNYSQEIEDLGGKCFKISATTSSTYVDVINRIKPDIIHNHVLVYGIFLIPSIRKVFDGKIIGHSHSSKLSNTKLKRIRNKLLTLNINNLYDAYFYCSTQAKEVWFKEKRNKVNSKFFFIPNSVDCNLISEINLKKRNKVDNDLMRLIHIGRFSVEKNQIFLLELISVLKKTNTDFHLTLIGDGKDFQEIENKIIELGLSNFVTIINYLPTDQLYELLSMQDFFLFPSLFEGFGTVLIEAQMLNVKSIANSTLPKETNIGLIEYENLDVRKWIKLLQNQELWNKRSLTSNHKEFCVLNASKRLIDIYGALLED